MTRTSPRLRHQAGCWLALASLLAPTTPLRAESADTGPGLPILVYHQLRQGTDGPPDSLESISVEQFDAHMRQLSEAGYVTLSAREVVEFVRDGSRPSEKIVAIHFDDGWKSVQRALPGLERHGFRATFWIIAGTGIGEPHMDWVEIEAIAREPRYDVYSHSMTHPWKAGESMTDWMEGRTQGRGAADARRELLESRAVLETRLGRPVLYFAWPGGHYNDALIRLGTDLGYEALFTVNPGVNRPKGDLLRIRRTMIHGGCGEQALTAILRDGLYRDCGPGSGPAGVVASPVKYNSPATPPPAKAR